MCKIASAEGSSRTGLDTSISGLEPEPSRTFVPPGNFTLRLASSEKLPKKHEEFRKLFPPELQRELARDGLTIGTDTRELETKLRSVQEALGAVDRMGRRGVSAYVDFVDSKDRTRRFHLSGKSITKMIERFHMRALQNRGKLFFDEDGYIPADKSKLDLTPKPPKRRREVRFAETDEVMVYRRDESPERVGADKRAKGAMRVKSKRETKA